MLIIFPSEWWLVLFPALPMELAWANGERGSNGEKETLGVFWRMGFTMMIESYHQATGVQMENGVHYFAKQDVGVQMQ